MGLFGFNSSKKKKNLTAEEKPEIIYNQTENIEDGEKDAEIVAVITAAIASSMKRSAEEIRVVSFRRLKQQKEMEKI